MRFFNASLFFKLAIAAALAVPVLLNSGPATAKCGSASKTYTVTSPFGGKKYTVQQTGDNFSIKKATRKTLARETKKAREVAALFVTDKEQTFTKIDEDGNRITVIVPKGVMLSNASIDEKGNLQDTPATQKEEAEKLSNMTEEEYSNYQMEKMIGKMTDEERQALKKSIERDLEAKEEAEKLSKMTEEEYSKYQMEKMIGKMTKEERQALKKSIERDLKAKEEAEKLSKMTEEEYSKYQMEKMIGKMTKEERQALKRSIVRDLKAKEEGLTAAQRSAAMWDSMRDNMAKSQDTSAKGSK